MGPLTRAMDMACVLATSPRIRSLAIVTLATLGWPAKNAHTATLAMPRKVSVPSAPAVRTRRATIRASVMQPQASVHALVGGTTAATAQSALMASGVIAVTLAHAAPRLQSSVVPA